MDKKALETVVGPLFGSISGYFNLPAYLKLKWAEHKRGKKSYFREEQYWKDALGGDFYIPSRRSLTDGCIVELQQFELSEWFPRAPGSFWTKLGFSLRRHAEGKIEQMGRVVVLTPYGKWSMIRGGIGTLRLEPHEVGDVSYKILGATSSGDLNCAVPVVMPLSVYEKIRDRLLEKGSLCATLSGIYTILPISREEMFLEAAGAELPRAIKIWIGTSHYVPRNCVLVESILLVENVRAGLGVRGAAWSIYENQQGDYGCTYASFDPRSDKSLNQAVDFLNRYSINHKGDHFLTEFDEKTARLNPTWPIKDVITQAAQLGSRCKSMLAWGKKIRAYE